MKKYRLLFWAAVGLVCLSILSNLPQDRYAKTITGADMQGSMGVVGGASRGIEFGMTAPAGLLTQTENILLDKGSYKLILRYHTYTPGNTVRVVSPGTAGPDNSLGLVLAEAELPTQEGGREITLPFTLPHGLADVQVQTLYGGEGEFLVHHASVMSVGLFYTDTLFIVLFLLLLALWIDRAILRRPLALGEAIQDRFSRYAPVFLVLALGFLASTPILNEAITLGHDVHFHITRLEGIASAFLDGQFPPRINPDALNYRGYASSLMYPDLLLWPFALLRLLGFSWLGTYKLVCVATNFASAATAYLAASRLFQSRFSGAIASVLYALAQYRLHNLYERDALGEALAMTVFPLLLWGLYEVYFGNAKKWPLLCFGVTLVFQSHIITTFISLLFCALFFLVFLPYLVRNKQRILPLAKAAGLTLLLNLWYIVPLVTMMQEDLMVTEIHSGLYTSLHTVTSLFFAHDGLYRLTGIVLYLAAAALLACLLLFRKTEETAKARGIGGAALGFGTLFTFLACTLAPWYLLNFVPFISKNITRIQYGFRFFAVVCIFFTLCGAAVAFFFRHKARGAKLAAILVLTGLCFLVATPQITATLPHRDELRIGLNPAIRTEPPLWHITESAHAGLGEEYLYRGHDLPSLMLPGRLTSDGALAVSGYEKDGTHLRFAYSAEGATYIDLPLLYYPGYQIQDAAGKALGYSMAPSTEIRIQNPPQSGGIQARYTGLWWWRISDAISLAGVLGCAVWALRRWRRRVHAKRSQPG